MTTSVIVAGARTPICNFRGGLATIPASELGSVAIRATLEKARINPSDIEYAILGQVLTTGAGQLPPRQATISAGLEWSTPAVTVSKVCLSGINAIATADQLIRAGEYETILAGGMESMSLAPHYLPTSRGGYGYGDITMYDAVLFDGLRDAFTGYSMGVLTEAINAETNKFTREQQDEFAVRSHALAVEAWKNGIYAEEVTPVSIKQRDGDLHTISLDENVRAELTMEHLATLKPAFMTEGTITAASASPLSDGAATVVVMSKDKAQSLGLEWLAEIVTTVSVAGPDSTLQLQPSNAIKAALKKASLTLDDLNMIEINEAFAAVALASIEDLEVDPDIVNIHGGALALGHPIGMSGARVTLHVALELARRGYGYGVASLCGGGGQGEAIILKR